MTHLKMTTKEMQNNAIQAARKHEWMVCTEGDDRVACVIAWSRQPGTNWCRVLTIVDGVGKVETVHLPKYYKDPNATVVGSDYVGEHLNLFKLTTQS
jgi:hypothetical protein